MTAPLPPSITHVTKENFVEEVMNSDKLVLIDFYADWCGPCKSMAPTLEQFAAENPDVKVVKINIDKSPELMQAFGVRSIPTLVTIKDGKGLAGSVGAVPKSKIEELIRVSLQKLAITPAPKQSPQPPTP